MTRKPMPPEVRLGYKRAGLFILVCVLLAVGVMLISKGMEERSLFVDMPPAAPDAK